MGKKIFIIILFISVFSYSYAQDLDKKYIKLIEKVLYLSGVKKQIEGIEPMVNAQFAQFRERTNPEVYAKISLAITQAYHKKALYSDIFEYFKSHFNEERLSEILEWYLTPLSKKITKLEIRASTPEGMWEMNQFATQLVFSPPSRETIELMQRLDEATNASDLVIEIYLTTNREMLEAINSIVPPSKRLADNELENIVTNITKQVQPSLKYTTLITCLYTYRSLSEEEIIKYTDFYRTDNGKWLVKTMNDAFLNVVGNAAKKVSKELITAALEQKNKMEAALNKEGLSYEDVDTFFYHYYLNPQPDKLIKVLKFFLSQHSILTDNVHFGPLEHLFATVACRDSAVLDILKNLKKQYSGKQKESLNRIIDQAENFKSPEPNSARNLDFLWCEFIATGKEEPIKKIIYVL